MKIIVCIKQVPDTTEVRIDPVKGTLIRDGVPSILNPDDNSALEEALRIKETLGQDTTVTVITMGPPQAEEILRQAMAMGADSAYLLSDRAFAGSDTWATSNAIAAAIKSIDNFDIVFCGRQAIDGDTAQVGPQIAQRLGMAQVTYVQSLRIEGNSIIVDRALEDGYETIEVNTPVLLTAIKELNTPRYMSINGIFDAFREKEIKVLGIKDIGLDPALTGLTGSPTQVRKSFTPEPKGKGEMLTGSVKEMSDQLVIKLKQKHLI